MANNTPISSGPTGAPLTSLYRTVRSANTAGQNFAGVQANPGNVAAVKTMQQVYTDAHKFGVVTAGEVKTAQVEYANKLRQTQAAAGVPHEKKPGI